MKIVKPVVMVFVFLFFASGLSLISHAAEDRRQKAPAAKSAPRGGGHQNIQRERRGVEQHRGRPQGNIQRERRGVEQHRGEHTRRPGITGERRVERRHPGVTRHVEHYNFRSRHYHTFTVHERTVWHRGAWRNGCFRGNCGSWWVTGGYWYYYPDRVYGVFYPSVISSIVFEAALIEAAILAPVVPPPVVIARPPLVVQPQAPVLYYCPDPPGYSPEVQNCNVGWQTRTMPPPPQK